MSKLQEAFNALEKRLEQLYGAEHTHDFQKEFDALAEEIAKSAEVKVGKK